MLKKDITYKDLDDNDVTETFWFHLSKAELAEMALSKEGDQGGFEQWVRTLMASRNGAELTKAFKELLLATIGERSEDNKRFIKSDEIRNNFQHSDAYSELFMELLTDADKMSAFVNGIVPSAMRDEVQKKLDESDVTTGPDLSKFKTPEQISDETKDDTPMWEKENRDPNEFELRKMTPEQMRAVFARRLGQKQAEEPTQA